MITEISRLLLIKYGVTAIASTASSIALQQYETFNGSGNCVS